MRLVALPFFVSVPRVRGFVSVRSADPLRHSRDFSTRSFSEATLSPLGITETESLLSKPTCSSDASTRKRLGKSSFLYKQQTKTDERKGTPVDTTVSSSVDLRQLAEQHSGKTVGSLQYKKAWTRWLYLSVESIRQDLGESLLLPAIDGRTKNNDDEDDDDKDPLAVRRAFEKLFFDLGVAADEGTMPSFESGDARRGYALEFFCRARALAEFFLETPLCEDTDEGGPIDDSTSDLYPEFWIRSLRSPDCPVLGASWSLDAEADQASTYEIVSLGGGPGFDFVGVALAAAFSFHTGASGRGITPGSLASIHVTAMDYEEGWSDLVSAMDRSTRNLLTPSTGDEEPLSPPSSSLPVMSCDWGGKCDITKSILNEPVNDNCKRLLLGDDDDDDGRGGQESSRLWICQYCVAENAKALRDSDYVFLKELVREMSTGTLVLLTEVVPRLWPEMVRMLDREGLLPMVDVGFRRGYRGKQFMLRKRETRRQAATNRRKGISSKKRDAEGTANAIESLDDRTRDQLEHFERLASYHDRKVGSGWKRQGRKANGSVYHEEQEIRYRQSGTAKAV